MNEDIHITDDQILRVKDLGFKEVVVETCFFLSYFFNYSKYIFYSRESNSELDKPQVGLN